MRKLTRNTLATAAVTTMALGLTAAPALAATFTVTGGTSITGSASEPLAATVARTGAFATCDTATASGTAVNGSGLSGTAVASLTAASFSDSTTIDGRCPASTGAVGTLTANNLPWSFNVTSVSGGVATGTLTGVKATAAFSDGCTIVATGPGGGGGTINGTYTNASGELRVLPGGAGSNLVVTSATGCNVNDAQAGDALELDGAYTVSPKLTITQQS
ncbi:hypothetical protein [Spirillospora sp. NPDC047279]|uniref:hypothetical protein n=1 Tax=Spirillospora sp. NPDC047279 TaxID=3155478 RepID=UPI0033CE62CF